jgi:hypothetical protein
LSDANTFLVTDTPAIAWLAAALEINHPFNLTATPLSRSAEFAAIFASIPDV